MGRHGKDEGGGRKKGHGGAVAAPLLIMTRSRQREHDAVAARDLAVTTMGRREEAAVMDPGEAITTTRQAVALPSGSATTRQVEAPVVEAGPSTRPRKRAASPDEEPERPPTTRNKGKAKGKAKGKGKEKAPPPKETRAEYWIRKAREWQQRRDEYWDLSSHSSDVSPPPTPPPTVTTRPIPPPTKKARTTPPQVAAPKPPKRVPKRLMVPPPAPKRVPKRLMVPPPAPKRVPKRLMVPPPPPAAKRMRVDPPAPAPPARTGTKRPLEDSEQPPSKRRNIDESGQSTPLPPAPSPPMDPPGESPPSTPGGSGPAPTPPRTPPRVPTPPQRPPPRRGSRERHRPDRYVPAEQPRQRRARRIRPRLNLDAWLQPNEEYVEPIQGILGIRVVSRPIRTTRAAEGGATISSMGHGHDIIKINTNRTFRPHLNWPAIDRKETFVMKSGKLRFTSEAQEATFTYQTLKITLLRGAECCFQAVGGPVVLDRLSTTRLG